jgi:hypothetical protein
MMNECLLDRSCAALLFGVNQTESGGDVTDLFRCERVRQELGKSRLLKLLFDFLVRLTGRKDEDGFLRDGVAIIFVLEGVDGDLVDLVDEARDGSVSLLCIVAKQFSINDDQSVAVTSTPRLLSEISDCCFDRLHEAASVVGDAQLANDLSQIDQLNFV